MGEGGEGAGEEARQGCFLLNILFLDPMSCE